MSPFERAVEAATAATDLHEAGRCWVEAARIAVDAGALPTARQALAKAGEAFRRDDRVADALRALELARTYLPARAPDVAGVAERVLLDVQIAGLHAERGALDEAHAALDRADFAIRDAGAPLGALVPHHDLVRDTRIGLHLGHGRKEDARTVLVGVVNPVARAFRLGQLRRLDGELSRARVEFADVVDALAGRPGAEAGLAGARMELAELAILEGHPEDALPTLEDAVREHLAAGRAALRYRAEAAKVRAATAAGLAAFPGPVREGLAYAAHRGLPLLEADLHLAAGTALAGSDPALASEHLRAAVATAEALRVPLTAGRARLVLAELAGGSPVDSAGLPERQLSRPENPADRDRVALLEHAADDSADHVPLRDRARAALGRRHVPRTAWRIVPWKNGRGTTTELAVDPSGAGFDTFRWRLSTATVAEDGPFSTFAGVDRALVILSLPCLELVVDGVAHRLTDRHALLRFPGDAVTTGAVPEGPVRDLNLMVRRGIPWTAEVVRGRVDLVGTEILVVPLDRSVRIPALGEVAPLEVAVARGRLAFESAGDLLVAILGEHSG